MRNQPLCTPVARSFGFPDAAKQRHIWPALTAGLLVAWMTVPGIIAVRGRVYAADAGGTVASGAKLYVRLVTPVSTKTSHLNQAVTASVVREVDTDHGVLIPVSAEVTGKIQKLIPTSEPSDHARLLIQFNQLIIPRRPSLDPGGALDRRGERT